MAGRFPQSEITTNDRGSRRVVLAALCLIGAVFVLHAVANQHVIRATERRTSLLERDLIRRVSELARVSHDVAQERVLVDDHIFETSRRKMGAIEAQLEEVATDLRSAQTAYAGRTKLPAESADWRKVAALIQRFQDALSASLDLSRENRTFEARAKILEVRADYSTLERSLATLVETNRAGATASSERVEQIEHLADLIMWANRCVYLVGAFLLAGWMLKRVALYESRLRDHADLLETRNRELDSFAGQVAHDVKNALAPIAMSAMALRRAAFDAKQSLETAERTERCCRRLTGIVDALLAFSRASRDVQANEASQIKDVLENVLDEIAPSAARVGATIEAEEVAAETTVRCDARLLHIVLANLVGNGVKYLAGRSTRRVIVSAHREASLCRIEVQDTGPGIPGYALDKIFEPFYRVEGAPAPGIGIGLATVRRIVDARGGRVAVESDEGNGSRFLVWLPLVQSGARTADAADADTREASGC